MRRSITAAAAAASLWTPVTVAQDISDSSCVDGLFMIVARGTNEDPGPGVTGLIAERIASRIKDSDVVALDYPATYTDPLYTDSVNNGTQELSEVIRNYTESCPDGKMAVFGYSQGAHVSSNVFCGGTGRPFDDSAALPKDLVDEHIISIFLFGDPSHVANTTYDIGTSKNDGIFERPNITACEDYTFMKSYCDTGDVYCDSGDIRSVHGGYLGQYGTEVVTDVLKAWNKATDGDVDTSGGPSFGEGSSGNSTETPAATPSATTSSTMTSTQTQTETETSTETGSGDGQGGGNEPDAAVGLSAMGSLLVGAPMMMLALWNVL
jgi:acetylxylan esterase